MAKFGDRPSELNNRNETCCYTKHLHTQGFGKGGVQAEGLLSRWRWSTDGAVVVDAIEQKYRPLPSFIHLLDGEILTEKGAYTQGTLSFAHGMPAA